MGQIIHITKNGKPIIHSNLRATKDTEMVALINAETDRIMEANQPFRIIVDVTDSFTTPKFMQAAYSFASRTKGLMICGAILGISGVKKVLLKGYNRVASPHVMEPFDSFDEAVAYVTSK